MLAGYGPSERNAWRRAERTDIDARRGKGRRARGDREVARGHELTPGGSGESVHFRDHRLRHPRDRRHHPAALREERLNLCRIAHGPDLLEVVPGAEPSSARADHDDAYGGV